MNNPDVKRRALRQYISHWAFLPLGQFGDDDPLGALRNDFGLCSKGGMLTDALYPISLVGLGDYEHLDTVNDFMAWLESNGITKLNKPPDGYP